MIPPSKEVRIMAPMPKDIEIAQAAKVQHIEKIAEKIGLSRDDLEFYGKYKAKVPLDVLKRFDKNKDGKLVFVTAITATKAGEGKTVTSIALCANTVAASASGIPAKSSGYSCSPDPQPAALVTIASTSSGKTRRFARACLRASSDSPWCMPSAPQHS